MKRLYSVFLRLYPRQYRDLFGTEVLNVFTQAAREHRARGWSVWARFLLRELSGAVVSAAGHWFDRLSARHPADLRIADLNTESPARPGLFGVAREAQNRVDSNLKNMTNAIASRDFARARAYSIEDLKARDELRKLRDRYGFDA